MNVTVAEFIKNLPLFKSVSGITLQHLFENSQVRAFTQNETLLQKGTQSNSLYIIYTGQVKIVGKGYRTREVILNQFGPGQIIGETSLIDRVTRSTSVIAISPEVEVVDISYDTFSQALNKSPELAQNFIGITLERMRFSNLYIEKAIELTQAVAEGDYKAVQQQIENTQISGVEGVDLSQANEARIGAFLSAFVKMIEGVKQREDFMKKQLEQQFEIRIDTSKKDQDVENLAKRTFFYRVKTMADQMRERRKKDSKEK